MTPQERVEAYIRDWHQSWREHGGESGAGGKSAQASLAFFENWRNAVKRLSKIHWSSAGRDESDSGFGTPPLHDPATERFRSLKASGDTAIVETICLDSSPPTYSEYELVLESGSWKIAGWLRFFSDEDEPAIARDELERLLSQPATDAKLAPPCTGDEPNCEVLFESGRLFCTGWMKDPQPISVRRAGKLSLPSGAIVVREFGYFHHDARPLSLRVPPGDYDVQISLLGDEVVAARVLFDPAGCGPFEYRRAVRIGEDDSDAGDNSDLLIADAGAFMDRTKREHTRDCEAWRKLRLFSDWPGDVHTAFVRLSGSHHEDAVVIVGDKGGPAYWVLDRDGAVVRWWSISWSWLRNCCAPSRSRGAQELRESFTMKPEPGGYVYALIGRAFPAWWWPVVLSMGFDGSARTELS